MRGIQTEMDLNLWGLDTNKKDHLRFGGCDVVELGKHYGTPLHIVDESRLWQNYRTFRNAFQEAYPMVKVFYSYKTNCVPGVLKILHDEGCGAEVISSYEFWLASQLKVEPSEIIYNDVNKSVEYLKIVYGAHAVYVSYYATTHALLWLLHTDGSLVDACQHTVDWLLHTQRHDGSWGFFGDGTAEETAYVLSALLHNHCLKPIGLWFDIKVI